MRVCVEIVQLAYHPECSAQGTAVCAVSSLLQLLSCVSSTTCLQLLEAELVKLQVCADTMVGNQMVRGISGGQKKRVTSGGPQASGSVTNLSPSPAPTHLNRQNLLHHRTMDYPCCLCHRTHLGSSQLAPGKLQFTLPGLL